MLSIIKTCPEKQIYTEDSGLKKPGISLSTEVLPILKKRYVFFKPVVFITGTRLQYFELFYQKNSQAL